VGSRRPTPADWNMPVVGGHMMCIGIQVGRLTLECRWAILLYYSPREYAVKRMIRVNIPSV
jgi:hypothetical protein